MAAPVILELLRPRVQLDEEMNATCQHAWGIYRVDKEAGQMAGRPIFRKVWSPGQKGADVLHKHWIFYHEGEDHQNIPKFSFVQHDFENISLDKDNGCLNLYTDSNIRCPCQDVRMTSESQSRKINFVFVCVRLACINLLFF